jgi:hypothetical protein
MPLSVSQSKTKCKAKRGDSDQSSERQPITHQRCKRRDGLRQDLLEPHVVQYKVVQSTAWAVSGRRGSCTAPGSKKDSGDSPSDKLNFASALIAGGDYFAIPLTSQSRPRGDYSATRGPFSARV